MTTTPESPEQKRRRALFSFYEGDETATDRYVQMVAESIGDPVARRTLQLMHGIDADTGGDDLLMDVCDDIQVRQGQDWPLLVERGREFWRQQPLE